MTNQSQELITTARKAGAWYLVLAISGMVGFLILHSRIYVSDVTKTVANLSEQETLARVRLLLEFTIVVSQAVAAVYFFKLFKGINHFASWALAAWGMMNAGLIIISAMAMAGAIKIANADILLNEKVFMVTIFNQLISNAWGVGSLFFGLWLIPMGYIVNRSQCMPVWLGRILLLGGIGYILNTYLNYMGVTGAWVDMLPMFATIGEFWMIGYLLIYGIRTSNLDSLKG